jgi:hypothetical protein
MIAVTTVGCESDPLQVELWQGEQEIVELGQRLKLYQFKLGQYDYRRVALLEKLLSVNRYCADTHHSLLMQTAAMKSELMTLETEYIERRKSLLMNQRKNAVGIRFKTISLVSGRTYEDAEVVAVDDAGVAIRHANGSARLRFKDLYLSQQAFFGLEDESAQKAEDQEAVVFGIYNVWVDQQVEYANKQKKEVSENAEHRDLALQQGGTELDSGNAAIPETPAFDRATTPSGNQYVRSFANEPVRRSNRAAHRTSYYYYTPNYQVRCPQTPSAPCVSPIGVGCTSSSSFPKFETCFVPATTPYP